MRHRKSVRKLGVKRPHRRAMLSNLANSLIDLGRIKTTTARAKVLQGDVERLITLAKRGDVHSRRQALSVLRHRASVRKLFEEIAPEFKNMNGGFTRRAYFGRRLGDGASLSVVELNIEKKFVEEPKKKGRKKASAEKSAAKTEETAEKPKKKRVSRKKKSD
jgi:large subunit ribosomal protein L17